ncbi:MAG: FecR domain-containing protein, partial [Acidobacteria bacterium]|nr:FecR domain-containing protein [Acidobacteriota bacterium]
MKRLTYLAALGTLLLVSLTVLAAQTARAQEEQDQDSDTGVARVSLIRGDVTVTRGDSGDQVATSVNSPLVRGDKIVTGEKSQTEIQLDHSNIIRLAPSSEIRIADLTRSVIQIQVAQGLVNYTVFKTNEANIELDTPNMAVRPIKEGSYRIQVNSPTETLLIVRKGDSDVTTQEGTVRVEEGRLITVRGAQNPEYQIANAPGRDDWDKWNKDRDDVVNNAKSFKYANRYYTGAQDLDSHGRWVYMPDDGEYAWTPYVRPGWSPYYSGYWGWEPYWGWTWISYEPWGWAPYHYGRWGYYHNSWYWYPGPHYYGYRPLWGPAWVSFIGFGFGGHNWGFGFGYGYSSIGWCPLGRYDSYHPWWGRHNSYTAVNITNITNVTNVTNINRGGRGGNQWGREGYQSNLQAALTNANVRGGITRVSA